MHDHIEGMDLISEVISIDQKSIGKTSRSIPATYMEIFDEIRTLFANTEKARDKGYKKVDFSFNIVGGRCEECAGEGVIVTNMHFMPNIESVCHICNGKRFSRDILSVDFDGHNIAEVLDMSVDEALSFFRDVKKINQKLKYLHNMGLGYLKLGQSSVSLSGGEAQRIKLAYELGRLNTAKKDFISSMNLLQDCIHLMLSVYWKC